MQSRRTFIKKSCAACIGMSALGILLESCATPQHILKPAIENNSINIGLNNFQTNNSYIIRNKKLPFDILVVKNDMEYTALQMRCTHNDVALNFSGKKIVCTAHGSEFDLKGNVTKEPAATSLTRYKTSINEQQLIIHLN